MSAPASHHNPQTTTSASSQKNTQPSDNISSFEALSAVALILVFTIGAYLVSPH